MNLVSFYGGHWILGILIEQVKTQCRKPSPSRPRRAPEFLLRRTRRPHCCLHYRRCWPHGWRQHRRNSHAQRWRRHGHRRQCERHRCLHQPLSAAQQPADLRRAPAAPEHQHLNDLRDAVGLSRCGQPERPHDRQCHVRPSHANQRHQRTGPSL